jgi:anti-sigma factor RsiW
MLISLLEMAWPRGEVMSECPSDEMLGAFVDHCLRVEQRQEVEEHLADCRRCRKIVVTVYKIKKAIPEPEIPSPITAEHPTFLGKKLLPAKK